LGIVDVAFDLRGGPIPGDHGYALYHALAERLQWLESEEQAGVHPIRGARGGDGSLYLNGRARLMLRLPLERAGQALALAGTRLELGARVEVGAGRVRQLVAYRTLYSPLVVTGHEDEKLFQGDVAEALRHAGIDCQIICGKAQRARAGAGEFAGFSLMLHPLTPEESLQLQHAGLGMARKMGCGIFIPHRSAAAVGA
jgi:CRISPR-associated protein Cas6